MKELVTTVAVASLKFNALLQGWVVGNEHEARQNQNLRLRRFELKFSGEIHRGPKYLVMADPSRLIPPPNGTVPPAKDMIRDFSLSQQFGNGFDFAVGQLRLPTTAEGLDPSSDLALPERSLVGRTLGYSREMGARFSYKAPLWSATSMVSSGRSVSGAGHGMLNDLDSRAELTPLKNLGFGAFVVFGKGFSYTDKGRWGANVRYRRGPASIRSEYAQAKDGARHSRGTTTELGYWITENFEPVVRYETFNSSKAESIGVNYYVREYNTKVQVAGSVMQNMISPNGTPTVEAGVNNKEVTVVLQESI